MTNQLKRFEIAGRIMAETMRHPVYPLQLFGSEVLHEECVPVKDTDQIPLGLLTAMKEATRHWKGLGISAPQLGVPIRLVLVGKTFMVNPEITWRSGVEVWGEEGCLSIPDTFVPKLRDKSVVVHYQTEMLTKMKMAFNEMDARCVQHELDHLDGKLIIDGVTRQRRRAAERARDKWVEKQVNAGDLVGKR